MKKTIALLIASSILSFSSISYAKNKESSDVVFFNLGSYSISESEKSKIETIANGNSVFYVFGSSDFKGEERFNLLLSEDRTNSVVKEIQSITNGALIYYIGIGESNHYCKPISEFDKQYCNRAVKIIAN